MNELELRFHKDMLRIYNEAKRFGYNAERFKQMVASNGGLAAAHKLLSNPQPSDGFTTLWEHNRLDLSVEALVLKVEYKDLFTEDERVKARWLLKSHDYQLDDPV